MTAPIPMSADEFLTLQLDERLRSVEASFKADALCIVGGIVNGLDDKIRSLVEELKGTSSSDRLVVLLTTNGGYIETVHRIVETIRHHYSHISMVIPNYAYSAGTVFAMASDDIWMDYYSRLGPIDPQVPNARTGSWVPANGYLTQYKRLLKRARKGTLSDAEVALLIRGFDQAELFLYEEAGKLSVALLKDWLVKYKFKNWHTTDGRKIPVTAPMKQERAVAIARMLGDTGRWHSHGYGISREEFIQDLNLKIDDLGSITSHKDAVHQYDSLLSSYMVKRGLGGILHTVGSFVPTGYADD